MPHPTPLLVTGMPRSGTTWLARLLARAQNAAMTGREPMNAQPHQYALAGTLDGWARLTDPTERQRRALRLAYRGWTTRVYGRFGVRQWAAPLRRTRVVVKDPFALLSIPAVADVTGARVVLVYRHPGAVLASYRRMGWKPNLTQFRAILDGPGSDGGSRGRTLPDPDAVTEAAMFSAIWAGLHELAIADVEHRDVVIVSHNALAAGGVPAGRQLANALGLVWTSGMEQELSRESSGASDTKQLHNLQRAPAEVAESWRQHLDPEEISECESRTAVVRDRLREAQLPLS